MADKYISLSEACKTFKISKDKLYRLIRDGLVPQRKDKRVNALKLKIALEVEEENKKKKQEQDFANTQEGISINLMLKKIKLRYDAEKAKLLELERKQREGQLVDINDIKQEWMQIAITLKTQILSWQSKLPPILEKKTKKQISEILKIQINELLEKLSQNE